MKRFVIALTFVIATVQLAACTGGSSSHGGNGPVPGPPAGGSHMYISSIANPNGNIFVYTLPVTSSSTPAATVTTIGGPLELYVDKAGRLWVPFIGSHLIWAFNTPLTSASTPSMILQTISQDPYGVTEDSNGNIFVALAQTNCCIDIFPAPVSGGQTASTEITWNSVSPHGLSFANAIATDSSNNIYVSSQTSIIQMQPPLTAASKPAQNVPAPLGLRYDIILDGNNNVYALNGSSQGAVDVYHQPFTSASTPAFSIKLSGVAYIEGEAFDPSGNLWLTEPGNNVWEISAPITSSSVPQKILTNVPGPYGIAFGP